MSLLTRQRAVAVFLAFAITYFLSTLIRGVTATLAPTLTAEFELSATDLGLLAGGYFLGFAAAQLPLGRWLDRQGPKKVILNFLAVAALGCMAFSWATTFTGLWLARVLCGVGLAACLMAPLTGYRRWLAPSQQLRAHSWMLMTGSLGMVASTLPVQWLLPVIGWRPVFVGLAVLLALSMVLIAWQTPQWQVREEAGAQAADQGNYAQVMRSRYFLRMTPVGFFNYGGMVAIQALWAVPWMTEVSQYTPVEAATSLFGINCAMLAAFWAWGLLLPRLIRSGLRTEQMMAWGTPLSLCVLALIVVLGRGGASHAGLLWALFCVATTVLSVAQPAIGMAFPPSLAGRALSAYNLVIFGGIFAVQWGIGFGVDAFLALGWPREQAYQGAMGVYLLLNLIAYLYYLAEKAQPPGEIQSAH